MPAPHPLDRAVWSALNGPQAQLAVTEGGARRYHPAYGVFAGLADGSEASLASLAALVARHGDVAFLEADPPTQAPGLAVVSQDVGVQMVLDGPAPAPGPEARLVRLTDVDAPAMLALATLTEPGPFFERTPQMGDFFGVKVDGALVAMAGERIRLPGFTEISGVCTHPDHRGRGLAAALIARVAQGAQARGETPFLHAYASNTAAIALYRRLGFTVRGELLMTRLTVA